MLKVFSCPSVILTEVGRIPNKYKTAPTVFSRRREMLGRWPARVVKVIEDEELRLRMGAQDARKKFNIIHQTNEYLSLYFKIIKDKK